MESSNLRKARKAAGLKQDELAAALKVNRATISKYENGAIELPVSHAKILAPILRVKWYELYPEERQGDAIASDLTERLKATSGKPWRKLSDVEAYEIGLLQLQFNSNKDRIAFFYGKLNTDGKLVASKHFYKNLDESKLAEVADYVEQLAKTPQYQRTEQPEDPPEDK